MFLQELVEVGMVQQQECELQQLDLQTQEVVEEELRVLVLWAHLQQLLKATKAARARQKSLPFGKLTPADEPAHVYDLNDE